MPRTSGVAPQHVGRRELLIAPRPR